LALALFRTSFELLTLDGSYCACTHYLVFKEPESPRRIRRGVASDRRLWPVSGEPSKVTTAIFLRQALFCQALRRNSDRSSTCISDGIETDSSLSSWRPSGEPFKNTG
jgi:hypothetical protein